MRVCDAVRRSAPSNCVVVLEILDDVRTSVRRIRNRTRCVTRRDALPSELHRRMLRWRHLGSDRVRRIVTAGRTLRSTAVWRVLQSSARCGVTGPTQSDHQSASREGLVCELVDLLGRASCGQESPLVRHRETGSKPQGVGDAVRAHQRTGRGRLFERRQQRLRRSSSSVSRRTARPSACRLVNPIPRTSSSVRMEAITKLRILPVTFLWPWPRVTAMPPIAQQNFGPSSSCGGRGCGRGRCGCRSGGRLRPCRRTRCWRRC